MQRACGRRKLPFGQHFFKQMRKLLEPFRWTVWLLVLLAILMVATFDLFVLQHSEDHMANDIKVKSVLRIVVNCTHETDGHTTPLHMDHNFETNNQTTSVFLLYTLPKSYFEGCFD